MYGHPAGTSGPGDFGVTVGESASSWEQRRGLAHRALRRLAVDHRGGTRGAARPAQDAHKYKLHEDQDLFDRAYGHVQQYY